MPSTEMEVFDGTKAMDVVQGFARAGIVSLDLVDPTGLSRDDWMAIGKEICQVGESVHWWIGDWLNFGEGLFGEDDVAAAVDDRPTRYDVANRITARSVEDLQNIRWVAASVAKTRRRPELSFTHHRYVAKLEPDDQKRWLDTAVKEQLSTTELQQSIRAEAKGEPSEPPTPDDAPTSYEQLFALCRELWGLAQPHPDGGAWIVPDEQMSRIVAHIGEE